MDTMKTYVIASVIFGLISGGICTEMIDNDNGTTTVENTTFVESTTEAVITTAGDVTTTVEPTAGDVTTTKPSTTPLPTPGPGTDPKVGSWVVKSDDNITCLRLDAAIQFKIGYEQRNEKFSEAPLNVPKNASLNESSCEEQVLTLKFDGNSFSLKFVVENDKVFAKQANLTYIVTEDVFPGAKHQGKVYNKTADNLTLFSVPKGKSYLCKDASKIDFVNATGTLTNIQVEAFKNSTKEDFSEADECSSDKISDIVPIAVGCALAALVIIVLIAYLVGRQRTRQKGYQSV